MIEENSPAFMIGSGSSGSGMNLTPEEIKSSKMI